MSKSRHLTIGKLGEYMAEMYLKQRRFVIIDRNFRRAWGEIDLVAQKDGRTHFVEVKTTECNDGMVPDGVDAYRPEDHMHKAKCARLARIIETYLVLNPRLACKSWTIDLAIVYIQPINKKVYVRMLHNVLITS